MVNEQRDAKSPFYVFIFIYNFLHVLSTSWSRGGVPESVWTFRRTSTVITQYIYAVPSVISEAVVSEHHVEGSVMQMFRSQSKQWQLEENEWLMIT